MIDTLLLEASPGELRAALLAAGKVWQVAHERRWPDADLRTVVGAVACGRVRRTDPGMNAAFVDLGGGADGFLRARDALDGNGQRDRGGRIERLVQEGSLVPVRIIGAGRDDKGPVVSMAVLRGDWADLTSRCQAMGKPGSLQTGPDLVTRMVTAYHQPGSTDVVTNDRRVANAVDAALSALGRDGKATLEVPSEGLFERYDVEAAIAAALKRRVPLSGGGSLVFDTTEALTVVDVDSGGQSGRAGRGARDVNLVAVSEIARQLRLRNIGGAVVIDALKLDRKRDREVFVQELKTALADDPARVTVHGVTGLGLVELTRSRRGALLASCLLEPPTEPSLRAEAAACDALRSLQRAAVVQPGSALRLRAAAAVIAMLEGDMSAALQKVETETGVRIALQPEPGWERARMEIEALAR